MSDLAVHLEAVRVAAGGRTLLEVPRLTIGAGECVAIVGPNGAGKSTLLKLMGAVLPAQQGAVKVLGRSLGAGTSCEGGRQETAAERRALRREIGLLMQGLHLVPRLTARENVLVGALGWLRGVDAWRSLLRWYPPALVTEADAAMAAFGLSDRAATRADALSGGERQKVALARLQLQQPRLWLADEPTSALDPAATVQVCDVLAKTVSGAGQTLVTVVHDLELLPRLATRVLGMTGGRVQWDAPIEGVTPAMLNALYDRSAAMASMGDRCAAGSGATRLART